MFHIDHRTGDAVTCRSSKCPLNLHFETAAEARAHFEAMVADFLFKPLSKSTQVSTSAHEDLNVEFSTFAVSKAAKAAPVDRGDWRAAQANAAVRNGDSRADATPNTTVSGYYDPMVQDDDESMFEPVTV